MGCLLILTHGALPPLCKCCAAVCARACAVPLFTLPTVCFLVLLLLQDHAVRQIKSTVCKEAWLTSREHSGQQQWLTTLMQTRHKRSSSSSSIITSHTCYGKQDVEVAASQRQAQIRLSAIQHDQQQVAVVDLLYMRSIRLRLA